MGTKPSIDYALVMGTPSLDIPAYVAKVRKGWAGYTRSVCVKTVYTASDGVRLLRRFMSSTSQSQHADLGARHALAAKLHRHLWTGVADRAAMANFGRSFQIADHRISAIGRDEFSDPMKDTLRLHARAADEHRHLAVLHYTAAGRRHDTSLRLSKNSPR